MSVEAETRYARSGDVSIAYQVTGDGPFDVVFVPGFLSQVEQDVRDALRWAVADGVVASLEVTATRLGLDRVLVEVALARGLPSRFQELWDGEDDLELGPVTLRLLTR